MTAPGIIAGVPGPLSPLEDVVPADPLLAGLRQTFGHAEFRPGQRAVVEEVVAGHDCIVVMPTGGGKSLCYQLPATLDGPPTVVVSPLIALMKDQIDGLRALGVAAAALHSNLDSRSQRAIEAAYRAGTLRLLYVAPERLVRSDLRAMLAELRPARIVIDEAHCISEWGHDFRRDYLRIGEVAASLAPIQLVACTATATPAVRDDIAARLQLRQPRVIVSGFSRPELYLGVHRVRDEAEKLVLLDRLLDPGDGHAIVYAGTRARAARVAEHLGRRLPTMLYHADLGAAERTQAQERFARGEVRVAVATSAFGMGVDVATVRQVFHLAIPSSLEEYYQQAGRAGRDGRAARCLIVHAPADRRLPEFFIEAAHPEASVLGGVHASLQASGGDPGAWRLVAERHASVAGLSDAAGDAAREILTHAGLIEPGGAVVPADAGRLPVDHGRIAAHRRLAYDRFGRLLAYLTTTGCRHRSILDHFGEPGGDARCGDRCDLCLAGPATGRILEVLPVRQALSAVARLNGRVGLARIAGVLAGSRGKQVLELRGATEMPTYGALSSWREADIAELLRRLLDAGALRQAPPPYPVASLTPLGVEVMKGTATLEIEDPRAHAGRPAPSSVSGEAGLPELDDAGRALLEQLRSWRTHEARRRGVPPYVVFDNRSLAELAARRPVDDASLLAVPGVGPGKLALYGPVLLALVAAEAV